MTEEQQAQESQEETEGQVQETTEEQQEQEGQEPQGIDDLPEWVQKEIRNLRKENAGHRTKLKEIEDKDKTELEKVQTRAQELEQANQQLQNRVRRSAFIEQINLPSPRLAWASLSDLSVDVEWDENGTPRNLEAVRKALKQEFPREFGDGSADGGARGPEPKQNDMNALIRGAAGR